MGIENISIIPEPSYQCKIHSFVRCSKAYCVAKRVL